MAIPGSTGVLIVADGDDDHVYWMEVDGAGAGSRPLPIPVAAKVPDPEDIAFDGTHVYVVGSQSRGGPRTDGLIRFRFDPVTRTVGDVERIGGLERLLSASVPTLGRRGRGTAGALNIEGLVWDAARKRLLFGLRAPLRGARAVVLVARLKDAAAPMTAANLAIEPNPLLLDLNGFAIRGMGYDQRTGRVLIIGGGSTDEGGGPFRLFDWDGSPSQSPRDRGVIRSLEKPEGVTPIEVAGRQRTLLVFDLGGYQLID